MKKIAHGESFKNFYNDKFIYIDKTKEIYALINYGRAFFSRPRRFGKSTILDTIATLFEKGVEPYFKDTWIYDKWTEKTYPVLKLNFLKYSVDDFDLFSQVFCSQIEEFANSINLKNFKTSNIPAISLMNLLGQAKLQDKRIVILIDEYDCQLTANINNPELYDVFQKCIRSIYAVMKGEEAIKFLGITGVTRLKDVSIFSVGSDINDATYDHRIASITGFTREEISRYYIDYINLTASIQNNVSVEQVTDSQREEVLDRLALEYNGYCFDQLNQIKVFSTWSVNKFFDWVESNRAIIYDDYWYGNGGLPSILKNYLESHNLDITKFTEPSIEIDYDDFCNPISLLTMEQNVLMCQTGYLTLNSTVPDGNVVCLTFPNNEVKKALSKLVANKMFNGTKFSKKSETEFYSNCSVDNMVAKFNLLLNTISYEHYPITSESALKMCLHVSFLTGDQPIFVEQENSQGRADIILNYERRRIVLELKYADGTDNAQKKLKEAISQIKEKDYGNVLPKKEELLRVALVFDKQKRQITHYQQV